MPYIFYKLQYVYIYIYICVCVCVCIYIYIYIYIYILFQMLELRCRSNFLKLDSSQARHTDHKITLSTYLNFFSIFAILMHAIAQLIF